MKGDFLATRQLNNLGKSDKVKGKTKIRAKKGPGGDEMVISVKLSEVKL